VAIGEPAIQRTIDAEEVYNSQDLRRWAAVTLSGDHIYIVTIDGRQWQIPSVNPPVVHFSLTGSRFAIHSNAAGLPEKGSTLIVDGDPAPAGHQVGAFVFSPDGKSWAYAGRINGDRPRNVIVRDGKEIHSFSMSGNETRLGFSPDSRHVAYAVAHGPASWALALDGEEAAPIYDYFPYEASLVFDSPDAFHTIAVRNGELLLVELKWKNLARAGKLSNER
jgi:hypothetical protein